MLAWVTGMLCVRKGVWLVGWGRGEDCLIASTVDEQEAHLLGQRRRQQATPAGCQGQGQEANPHGSSGAIAHEDTMLSLRSPLALYDSPRARASLHVVCFTCTTMLAQVTLPPAASATFPFQSVNLEALCADSSAP